MLEKKVQRDVNVQSTVVVKTSQMADASGTPVMEEEQQAAD